MHHDQHQTPSSPADDDHPDLALANARLGLGLFAFYLALYLGFMLGSAFAPAFMALTPFGGLNIALIYGLTLILSAFFLAVLYVFLCGRSLVRHSNLGRNRLEERSELEGRNR